MPEKQPSGLHAGHRKRMREEFLRTGGAEMEEHRLLELLLFYAIPQGDVNPLAHLLVDHFGSLTGVLHATYDQLVKVKGVGHNTAVLLQLIPAVAARYMRQNASFEHQIVDLWQLRELLEPYFFGQLGEGVVDTVQIATRKVLEAALDCNASQAVLAHNHVSGVAVPSNADVDTTLRLKRVLAESVGITLVDHLIFAGGDMVSMAQSGLLRGR